MKSLLIIEDDRGLCESLSLALEGSYSLSFAASAEEAELSLQGGRFDAIMLDERLPGLSGTQWLAAHRDQGLPPVMLVSANADPEMAIKALRLGAADCLAKPFDLGGLRRRLQSMLDLPPRSNSFAAEPFALAAARRMAEARDQPGQNLEERLQLLRRSLAQEALNASQGDLGEAARCLGLDEAELQRLLKP